MDDTDIARRYLSKSTNCKDSGIEFLLSFVEFKRIMTTKLCRYTGIELVQGIGRSTEASYCTVDRVDNSKGYIKGNVVACCYAYNQFKAVLENPTNIITFDMMVKAISVQQKLMKNKVKK
tara:strand:- start:18097 stop:18456 length:360 start_codon:yes stop_codon:yes gene_type:complete